MTLVHQHPLGSHEVFAAAASWRTKEPIKRPRRATMTTVNHLPVWQQQCMGGLFKTHLSCNVTTATTATTILCISHELLNSSTCLWHIQSQHQTLHDLTSAKLITSCSALPSLTPHLRSNAEPCRLASKLSHRCCTERLPTVYPLLSSTFFFFCFFSFFCFCFFCFFFFFYCFVLFGAKPAQMRSNIALSFSPCRWLHVCPSSVSNFCQCLS